MKRTVIIGDVHGCREELDDLLRLAAVDASDSVVFVGDLIARGPDSLGVLDRVYDLHAVSVIGNHERRLLEIDEAERVKGERPKLSQAYRQLVEQLRPKDWDYLRNMPYTLELPEHGIYVVHAGVAPGQAIDQQDPWALTHIRSVDDSGKASAALGERSWAEDYVGPHIVFGHSAQRGVQLHEHATGLDSGCVYGKRLTSLVLHEDEPVPPVSRRARSLVSVPARRVHFVPHSA
jgi:hypothetical protein